MVKVRHSEGTGSLIAILLALESIMFGGPLSAGSKGARYDLALIDWVVWFLMGKRKHNKWIQGL